jgi:hypothetical protein
MMTKAETGCSRKVEYEGMLCKQHATMLTKRWKEERDDGDDALRYIVASDDEVDDRVRELFGKVPSGLPTYDQAVADGPRSTKITKPSLAMQRAAEKERLGALAMSAICKGVYPEETCRIADNSGRWAWTLPPSNAKTPPTGYFGQFDIDGNLLVRCMCPGCTPPPRAQDKLCERPVMTTDHCVKCTCERCVCPARRTYGMNSNRALTGWWDNPCGGECGGCKRLARENAAGVARGWTA